MASENGDLAAQLSLWDLRGDGFADGFGAKATDRQTGEVCRPHAIIFW